MKRIAVLMTCYNRVGTTLECLRRLFSQKVPEGYSLDVWLVDDASPDKTGEKVKAAYPHVNVIRGTGKLFWCRGMRLAWDKAAEAHDYDFYLWLNDDVMLFDGAIGSLLRDAERLGDDKVLVGAFSDDESGESISYSAGSAEGTDIVPNGRTPQEGHGYFGGNMVLVPRKVFLQVGPICSFYHHGFGDFDYALQLTRKEIGFYVASIVCGWCGKSAKKKIPLRTLPLRKRIGLAFARNGFNVFDSFVFHFRNHGIVRAVLSVCHIFYRIVMSRGFLLR